MDNIFYFKKICKIGGTEQFLYEIAKKYHEYDITLFYDEADYFQLKRIRKYIRCIKRVKGNLVKCKKAFFNFNIDMIDEIEADEYIFVSHANYEELGYKPPIDHPKLTGFIGVSQFSSDKLEEYGEKLGLNIKVKKCYNPLTLEPVKKVPIIVSACRLDDKVKGGERTLKLIDALDRYCEKHNRQYLWMIFTNRTNMKLNSPNVVYMKPRVGVRPYIAMADWVAQLSNDMETYCYTTNEANAYGTPIITTPLSVYKELPATDNERIVLDWDCNNADEIARQVFEKEIKPFKYQIPNDDWDSLLIKGKSTYEEEKNMNVKVRCIKRYLDVELGVVIEPNENDKNYERVINRQRADEIIERTNGAIEILNVVKEQKVETSKLDIETEKAVKKTTKKKTTTKKKASK